MSTVYGENKKEEYEVGEGVKKLADDIADLLAYSNTFDRGPFTKDQIIEHLEDDEKYFEDDLEHVGEALDYLQKEERIKPDFVPGKLKEEAYSFNEYPI